MEWRLSCRLVTETGPCEEPCACGCDGPHPNDARRAVGVIEDEEYSQAPCRSAEQVNSVDAPDRERAAREGHTDDDPGEEERHSHAGRQLCPSPGDRHGP